MFNKYQNVFRSRWKALMWASGIMLTAYCTVPSPDGNDPAEALVEGAASMVAANKAAPRHVNPWALAKPAPPQNH